jgi:signal transduction histidine kinase
MGGDITVDSAPGMGARFVFTLPFRDPVRGSMFGA